MNDETETGELTLAFSLSAIDRLENPKAVFDDAEGWSAYLGVIDADTERIERLVDTYGLRQDFEMAGRDKWFALEEICETTETPRHVYIGACDDDMRISTLFDWEYIRVSTAAENADWHLAEEQPERGLLARFTGFVRSLLQ